MHELNKWLLFLPIIIAVACNNNDITRYVDPNIGSVAPLLTTLNPTVHRPHSMVRVFPITKPGLNDRYLSDKIYGFAVNMPAYRMGYVTELMPTIGKLNLNQDENASLYDYDLEEVHPWHHKVILEDSQIDADWTTRILKIKCDFLEKGQYDVEIFKDGVNANLNGNDYKTEHIKVNAEDELALDMAPGGGWAAVFTPIK